MKQTKPPEYIQTKPPEYIQTKPPEYIQTKPPEYIQTKPPEYIQTKPPEYIQTKPPEYIQTKPPEFRSNIPKIIQPEWHSNKTPIPQTKIPKNRRLHMPPGFEPQPKPTQTVTLKQQKPTKPRTVTVPVYTTPESLFRVHNGIEKAVAPSQLHKTYKSTTGTGHTVTFLVSDIKEPITPYTNIYNCKNTVHQYEKFNPDIHNKITSHRCRDCGRCYLIVIRKGVFDE